MDTLQKWQYGTWKWREIAASGYTRYWQYSSQLELTARWVQSSRARPETLEVTAHSVLEQTRIEAIHRAGRHN
jgi:hypothetical protein